MKLKIAAFALGYLPTNTYLGVNEETKHAFLVDPAVYDDSVLNALNEMGGTELTYILLTHGHFDHILGVSEFKAKHPEATVVISEADKPFLTDRTLSHSAMHGLRQDPIACDRTVGDGDKLPFDDADIRVLATPGHTAGSVCYLLDDVLFSGDTLFRMSCGRTDFPESVPEQMRGSLQKLASLEGNYQVLPGHEGFTNLEFERNHNPFLK